MSFGGDTIVFTSLVKSGSPDERGNYEMTEVPTSAPGCRHRPLTFTEQSELQFDIAEQVWKSTIPLFEYDDTLKGIVMAAKVYDVIEVSGVPYQISGGVKPYDDMDGAPFKMTILSKIWKA